MCVGGRSKLKEGNEIKVSQTQLYVTQSNLAVGLNNLFDFNVDKVVERVDVLLHKTFDLRNETK